MQYCARKSAAIDTTAHNSRVACAPIVAHATPARPSFSTSRTSKAAFTAEHVSMTLRGVRESPCASKDDCKT
eukprot:scaffold133_cov407-Prasinococcus_capsulatus_cf.AAC.11